MNRVLVWGLGKSGVSALELLKAKGIEAYGGDDARGDRWEEYISDIDTLVLSPGIPPSHPLWSMALKRDIEVMGELELASRFFKGGIVAITGTDGKSTTTELTFSILSKAGMRVAKAGNIGIPLSEVVLKEEYDVAVVEVSSFQGKTLSTFKPQVGAFLNFHPDHLDWHPDLRDYLESKHNIFSRQDPQDTFVEGSPQQEVLSTPTLAKRVRAYEVRTSGDTVLYRGRELFHASELHLKGEHNLRNAIVASLIAVSLGVPNEAIGGAIRTFRGLPFRMQFLCKFRGVEIYNDSKSTTPNSLKAGLESFPDNSVILIAGGKDKGADFSILRDTVLRKVKLALLIGETRSSMKTAFGGDVNSLVLDSLEDAVKVALREASPGDFILFSPGCSSFDMFSSYIERGESFNKLVREHCKL